jgi:hypothetical protein
MLQYLSTLHTVLKGCLASPNMDVRVAAVTATCAFIQVQAHERMCGCGGRGPLKPHAHFGNVFGFTQQCQCSCSPLPPGSHRSHPHGSQRMLLLTPTLKELENPIDRDTFQDTIPLLLAAIGDALNRGNHMVASEALTHFIDVAEAHPRFLRKQLQPVLAGMLQVGWGW